MTRLRVPGTTAGKRLLSLSAVQQARLNACVAGDPDAALAFAKALPEDPVCLDVEVLSTKHVLAGAGVSYGHTYRTKSPSRLARVAIGYGHGLPRKAGNRVSVTWISADGEPFSLPIVGRVAMDEFVIDLGEVPVKAGSLIRVFGDASRGETSLEDWAHTLRETPVSLVACLDERVERRVL